jgi:phage baseplate assembly protein V
MIGDEDDDEGHLVTGWLPMPGARSKNDSDWHPLEVGEGVVVLSPSGELAKRRRAPGGLYTDDDPAPGDKAGLWRRKFQDGGSIEYDRDSGEWLVTGMSKAASRSARRGRGDRRPGHGYRWRRRNTTKDGEITLTAGGVTLEGKRLRRRDLRRPGQARRQRTSARITSTPASRPAPRKPACPV